MSLFSLLTASGVIPADLVTAGVVAAAAQVYTGDQPRSPCDQRGEVLLERLDEGQVEGTGLQHVRSCRIRFRVRYPLNRGPDQAGATRLATVEAKLATIVGLYEARVRFQSTTGLSGSLPSSAVEGQVAADPETPNVLDGSVDVTFRVGE